MKAIIITMLVCYLFVFLFGNLIVELLFPVGGVAESYIKPIYLGIIFLSGLIVGCTIYLAEVIREGRKNNMIKTAVLFQKTINEEIK